MSADDQQTLADYHPQPTTETGERTPSTTADWNPGGAARRCLGCQAHVTRKFQRTHGDANRDVHACMGCVNPTWLPEAAANPKIAERARDELTDHQTRGTAGGHPGGTTL